MSSLKKQYAKAVIFASAMGLILLFLIVYLAVAPDFVAPAEDGPGHEEEAAVWSKTYDDLIAYLAKGGYIDSSSYDLLTEGVATEARVYGEVEIYWWDVENLAEGSDEYESWTSMKEDGFILLYGQFVFVPEMNGPFAISIHEGLYKGDAEALRAAFQAFPGKE